MPTFVLRSFNAPNGVVTKREVIFIVECCTISWKVSLYHQYAKDKITFRLEGDLILCSILY